MRVKFSRHDMMRGNAETSTGFSALRTLQFGFQKQSRLPRRLVPKQIRRRFTIYGHDESDYYVPENGPSVRETGRLAMLLS
jgi:hypothetical protein